MRMGGEGVKRILYPVELSRRFKRHRVLMSSSNSVSTPIPKETRSIGDP